MPRLDVATALRVGTGTATAAYLKGTQVWAPPAPPPPPPSTPTFRGAARNAGFSATNVVGAVPNAVTGDVLLAYATGNDQTASCTPPAGQGWTQIGDSAGAAAGRLYVFSATATATNIAGGTWTWPASHNHHVVVEGYGGVVLPTASSTAKTTNLGTVVAPSRTSVAANALMVVYGSFVTNGTAPAWPGTMTVRSPHTAASNSGVAADEALPTAGASGTRTFTAGGIAAAMSAATIILEPAA